MDNGTSRTTYAGAPAAPSSESDIPETRERRCPACHTDRIASDRTATAAGGSIKVAYRCEACGRSFYIARPSFT